MGSITTLLLSELGGSVQRYRRFDQVVCLMHECITDVVNHMWACFKETGSVKLLPANITADDPAEMIVCGNYRPSQCDLADYFRC